MAQQIEDDFADQREILRTVVLADLGGILTEEDIEASVQVVLDAPVVARSGVEGLMIECGRTDSEKCSTRLFGSIARPKDESRAEIERVHNTKS